MNIYVDNRQKRHPIDPEKIATKAETLLNKLGSLDGELSIVIVDDEEMATLNRTYLDRSGPTNVIAFAMREGLFAEVNPNLLGDVVISVETARQEARQSGISDELRFAQLLVHGILHLFGFDHERNSEEAEEMQAKEQELMKLL
jgi:probable rRNA maturation factor